MSPPSLVDRYDYSTLEPQFVTQIQSQSGLSDVGVRITSSALADLDQDGATDDLYGTALLQVGSQFKSFIFLLREDGAARFLENSGAALDASSGLRRLSCMESHSWLCHNTLERAETQIRAPRISMLEFDTSRAGLELVIHRSRGRLAIVNSLELFAGGAD